MEGFCRGCLVKYNEPTDLIPYSEKNRRLFIYSTGLQVKRNDTFTFQLCKECYLNMRQACIFKKQCRNSEKKFRNYMSLKENGDAIDFSLYIKNCEDLLTIRLPSGCSTPTHQKIKDDDNESTCTSIRNFMSDILQGEEVPDNEARIIRELIEEEADVLDDSLDSHWLQDDMSIATDFRMDFSFSPFSTPRSIQNAQNYTPKRLNDDKDDYFTLKHEKPPDEQYHMPILDDSEIDIDRPASIPIIPIDERNTHNYNQQDKLNHIKNGLKINESQTFEVENVDVESKRIETYFETEPKKIIEENFLQLEDKSQDFIAPTETENDFYNIANESKFSNNYNQSKVINVSNQSIGLKEIDESSVNHELEYYISKAELKKKSVLYKTCSIDRNLEMALKNEDNKVISLDQLIKSPSVDIRSGTSTPTITNILFGDTLDSNESPKIGQCIEKYQAVEGQTNILDDFLKDEDSNTENLKIKDEIVTDFMIHSPDIVKNKVKILDIKIIRAKDTKNHDIKNEIKDYNHQNIAINKSENVDESEIENISKNENDDIRDLIEDYVTNIYDVDLPQNDDKDIDALEILKATNASVDDSIFKRPLSPFYDKYDLVNSLCKICNKSFKTQLNLKIHFAKKHKFKIVDNSKKKIEQLDKVCDECGLTVKGKANLNRHKKLIHSGVFSCEECSLEFDTKYGLTIHNRTHNVNNTSKVYNQIICHICGIKVPSPRHNLHLMRHRKEFKFKCEICDKGFYTKGDLNIHLRVHTNTRPFKCKLCPKSFNRRYSLKNHYKRHLEEYICDICNKKFESKLVLRNHFGTKQCNPGKKTLEKNTKNVLKISEIRNENIMET